MTRFNSVNKNTIFTMHMLVGQKIMGIKALHAALASGDIVVQLNFKDLDAPFSGHASFFMVNPSMLGYELDFDTQHVSAISKRTSFFSDPIGLYRDREGVWKLEKMYHLADKGVLYSYFHTSCAACSTTVAAILESGGSRF